MVPAAKTGLSVPSLRVNPLRSALAEAARVTVTVYVLVVVPSCAVTTTVIVFAPTLRLTGVAALPPFTVTVAVESATVGVTVRLLTLLATLAL